MQVDLALRESWDVARLITVALGSGVISALITQGFAFFLAKRSQESEAAYTALRAAIQLEDYVSRAAQMLSDWKNVDYWSVRLEQERGEQQDRAGFPEFTEYVGDLEWRHVKGALSSRALSFPNETKASQQWITGLFEFDDEDGLEEMQVQAGIRALRAKTLAADLRRHYGLPPFTTDALPWDYMAFVDTRYRELLLRQAGPEHLPDQDSPLAD